MELTLSRFALKPLALTYDPTDAPSAITLKNATSTLQSFTYSNSPANTILSETDTPTSANSPAAYSYDAQGRVTSDTPGPGTALTYGFGASANPTTLPTGASGSYNNAEELTSSTLSGTATNYTYNADGGQLTGTQGATMLSTATWNGAQELATYNDSAANMAAATYDGNGVRASSTATPAGGTAVTQGYVWSAQQTQQLLMDGTNAYVYAGSSAPAEQVSLATGTITYLVADYLGSIRGAVSSAGALTGTTAYDAWGNPESAVGLLSTFGCVNIAKRCTDNLKNCGFYWNTEGNALGKRATKMTLDFELQVAGHVVYGPRNYGKAKNGNQVPLFHGSWGCNTTGG